MIDWLWQYYLAPGSLTLLTGQWKCGKTTLLALLLDRMRSGGSLLGFAVRPGKALVISEESREVWQRRFHKLGFGKHVCLICQPFSSKPTAAQWQALLGRIAELHDRFGFDLVVIDSLARFLPGCSENSSGLVLQHLHPLLELTRRGLAVLLVHHPTKGLIRPGQAARGSGALGALADITIEMHWYRGAADEDRRRRLLAWSRHDGTPLQLVIERNAEGTDYVNHGDEEQAGFEEQWRILQDLLLAAQGKLTRQEVRERWPDGADRPAGNTLWRWLERAVAGGRVNRDGTGERDDAFRYWLPEAEERWRREDPFYEMRAQAEADARVWRQVWGKPV